MESRSLSAGRATFKGCSWPLIYFCLNDPGGISCGAPQHPPSRVPTLASGHSTRMVSRPREYEPQGEFLLGEVVNLRKARTERGWPTQGPPPTAEVGSPCHTAYGYSFIRRHSTPKQAHRCCAGARRFDGCPCPICGSTHGVPRGIARGGEVNGRSPFPAQLCASLGALSQSALFLISRPASSVHPGGWLGAGAR